MTFANLEKKHKRLKWLVSGEFTERDFDYKIDANPNPEGGNKNQGEGGWSTMGAFVNKTGQRRKELIICKAKKALELFEKNNAQFIVQEKPPVPQVKETKSKVKK